ncbi:glycosyltransferase [Hyalangium rubrum]|uniref:Glycosyltransferase n=1 Tax=Hyalangium rubrum TaxID=3103134 RepID=A0ABU5HI46_9BACT|nr:glycosyltransferase [Hyalangium sp. s54d21]MDY7233148.1 glycosyltransferase [Hyalangium sp. s54d21]
MGTTAWISVAVPAFNEGARLPLLVDQFVSEGQGIQSPAVELVISDDGSRAQDAQRYEEIIEAGQERLTAAGAPHKLRCIHAPQNQGKGSAIRRAWSNAAAEARWLAFLDADGAVSGREFWRLAGLLTDEVPFDVLAASRVKMAGRSIDRKLFRHLQGRVFATLTEQLFGLGFYDTQCGLKFLRSELLRPVLERLVEDRWLLDVELLVLLRRQGARFHEEPVDWHEPGGSKVRFGVDPLRMLAGLVQMKSRLGEDGGAGESP